MKFQEYKTHFNDKVQQVKAGPVQERSCNDICCLITFFVLFVLTLGGGIYFLIQGSSLISQMISSTTNVNTVALGQIMAKYAPYIVGMIALSIALSIVFVVLSRMFPKCMVYSMIVLTFLVYIAVIVLGVVIANYALAIVFGIVLVINAIILWCYWAYISIGIVLLQCAGRFITDKPAVYFITGMCLVLNIIFTIFWVFSWLGVYSVGVIEETSSSSTSTYTYLYYVWFGVAIFFGFFLYYCMVFLIACACAYWYYQSEDNSVLKGFNLLKFQLGPITFASIIITIITVLRFISQAGESSDNGIIRCIACCIRCILSCIEQIMKALNHNSVIVMAVTGEGYISSAKSAIGLIFDNFGLFMIVDFFGQFMQIYQMIICVLFPSFIGGIIIYYVENNMTAAIWGAVIILLLASIISSVIIGMLDEALSCIFIFYCFDKKFHEMGIQVNNVPEEIKQLFDQGQRSEEAANVTHAYLNS